MSGTGDWLGVCVTCLRLEAQGVISIELSPETDLPFPPWEPGAHIDIRLPSGLVRQYSLCGDPDDHHRLRIAVLLEANGRGGSREAHGALRLGQRLEIRGPRNAFPLGEGPYLFVAGGIGITPILAMARAAERAGVPWRLLYGGRSRRSMAFVEELRALGNDRVQILPADEVGLLDLNAVVAAALAGEQVYCCGPGALLDALSTRFAQAELLARLHLERFSPMAASMEPASTDGLTVILAASGTQVEVPPGCSIMTALRAAGHQVPSSCEQGICGMCETRVLDGIPDHRDMLLSESERARGNVMMLCVSRALTPTLTLDL